MPPDLLYYSVLALSAFLIGFSKGGLGGMMGAFITALTALILPADQALGVLLPLLIVGDVFAVATYWRKWDRRIVWLLIPGALIGVTLAMIVLRNVSSEQLRTLLGIIILVFVFYRLIEKRVTSRIQPSASRWGIAAGVIAGLTSSLAHAGGPPITMYLLMQELSPQTFVATAAIFFAALNWIKLPGFYLAGLLDGNQLLSVIWVLPLLPLGVWLGRQVVQRVGREVFEGILTALLFISGVVLVIF